MIKRGKRMLVGLLVALALCAQAATVACAEQQAVDPGPGYTLREDATIAEEATPLAGMPEQECCALHPLLLAAALAVAVYYTHDRKQRQALEYELRARLLDG